MNPKKEPAVNIINQKDPTVKIIDRDRELRTCADGWKDPAVNIIDRPVSSVSVQVVQKDKKTLFSSI